MRSIEGSELKVLVTAPARFVIDPDRRLWTTNGSLNYAFWARYLDCFDEVRLCIRALHGAVTDSFVEATGPGIVAAPVPYFVGPNQYLLRHQAVHRAISEEVTSAGAIILRLPCHLGYIAWRRLRGKRPFGVELIADAWDALSPGAVRHPLRPFFRFQAFHHTRVICGEAPAIAYVTRHALQRRYPPRSDAYATHYSSVTLPDAAFVSHPRQQPGARSPARLITVGTMAQSYKAFDVLIDAVGICVRGGLGLTLTFVGDGKDRSELETQASTRGLGSRVSFCGELARVQELRDRLDDSDLFVLPSRQEGLPRAMIEAMARALPSIGSTVGGIPELLSPEDMVPPNDAVALASKIREVVTDPARMARMSARNLGNARQYHEHELGKRRIKFYEEVRAQTGTWLRDAARGGVRRAI